MWSVPCPGLLVTHCPQAPWPYSWLLPLPKRSLQVHSLSRGSGQGCWGARIPGSSSSIADRSWRINTPASSAQGGTALRRALIQSPGDPQQDLSFQLSKADLCSFAHLCWFLPFPVPLPIPLCGHPEFTPLRSHLLWSPHLKLSPEGAQTKTDAET